MYSPDHPDLLKTYRQAIVLNLNALRNRLRDALMRANAAYEASNVDDGAEIAIGALSGLEGLLKEATALHQAALILHCTSYIQSRESSARNAPPSQLHPASKAGAVIAVHREIDQLARLNALTEERAHLLKSRLTAAVVEEHLLQGSMSIIELIDMYNEMFNGLAAAEEARPAESQDSNSPP